MVLYTSGYTTQSIKNMAGQEGFEPPTFGFGDRRSAVGTTGLEHLLTCSFETCEKYGTRMVYVPHGFCKQLRLTACISSAYLS